MAYPAASVRGRRGTVTIPGMFASGEKGCAYNFVNPAYLFQNIARTVPVVSNNDPVAGVTDLSGLGKHAFCNLGGTVRPFWKSAGYTQWDGTDDNLETPSIDLTSGSSVITVFAKFEGLNVAGTSAIIVYESSTNFNTNEGAVGLYLNDAVAGKNVYVQRQTSAPTGYNIRHWIKTGSTKLPSFVHNAQRWGYAWHWRTS